MKKRRKWMLVVFFSILAVLVLFILVERTRGKRTYDSIIAKLRAEGEKLDVQELLPYRPDESENAAIEIIEMADQLPDLPSTTMSLIGPGFARPGYVLEKSESPSLLNPDENEVLAWEEIKRAIATSNVSFEQIKQILEKPYFHSGFSYTNGFYEEMNLTGIWKYRDFLAPYTNLQMRDSDTGNAVEGLRTMLLLVERMESERLMISQLVRKAIATICFRLTWDILTMPDLSEAQCQSLSEAWKAIEFIQPMAISTEMERAMTFDLHKNLKRSKTQRDFHFEQMESAGEVVPGFYDLPTSGRVLHWIHIPLWRVAWIDQDFTFGIQQWNNVIGASRLAWNGSWADAKDAFENLNTGNLFFEPDTSEGLSWFKRSKFLTSANPEISITGTLIKRIMQGQTEQQMAMAALALHSHKLQTGSYPDSLDELVPEYLAEIPVDFMDGKPLRYRKTEDRNFLLYSVGNDTEDNGGNPEESEDAEFYATIWDGKDAVWPKVFQETESRD